MTSDTFACIAALHRKGVAFRELSSTVATEGITIPILLEGPLDGVIIASHNKREPQVLDCRLALALLEWASILRSSGVQRLVHFSIYRNGATVQGTQRASGHAAALAIDVASFEFEDGTILNVLTDWVDKARGSSPCPVRDSEPRAAQLLRSLVCDAVSQSIFHVVLTPHYNSEHENHVHVEVVPGANSLYVR